jgi:hypothetical protein
MKTETIVIGNQKLGRELIPIKFNYLLNSVSAVDGDDILLTATEEANQYNYVELICLNYHCGKDLIFAYMDPNDRTNGMLFIGKWNDGIVA